MTDTYTEAEALFPRLARYRKLIVALLATTVPLVLFLVSEPHSAPEIVAAAAGWLLANFGVYRFPNASAP
jgi:hypothetical protein